MDKLGPYKGISEMNVHVFDPHVAREILRSRESVDSGHRDEVWEGVYYVMPDPNNEHQDLIGKLILFLGMAITLPHLGRVLPGGNISDRDDWTRNYRIPDVAVYLNDTSARDEGSHWLGGPDLAIEIVSPEDLSREKLPFYAKVGTREVLIVDRDPWASSSIDSRVRNLLSSAFRSRKIRHRSRARSCRCRFV